MNTRYRISFYRAILNDVGHQCRCRLDSIEIRRARSMERAIEAAKRRFARHRRIPVWDRLADGFEVDEVARTPARSERTRKRSRDRRPTAGEEKSRD